MVYRCEIMPELVNRQEEKQRQGVFESVEDVGYPIAGLRIENPSTRQLSPRLRRTPERRDKKEYVQPVPISNVRDGSRL